MMKENKKREEKGLRIRKGDVKGREQKEKNEEKINERRIKDEERKKW